MYFKRPFQSRKGSLILSIVASGAVAASIVASHQMAQNFASGTGQGMGYQQAYIAAQRALAIASLMVSRNVVACTQRQGCYIPTYPTGHKAEDFYNKLDISGKTSTGGRALTLQEVGRGSPLRMVSQWDSNNVKGSVVWSLRNWQQDPSVRAVFSLTTGSVAPFYKCQDSSSGNANEQGICRWNHEWSLSQVKDKSVKCKDNTGTDIDGTKCVFIHDNDGEIIFISVTIPYEESISGGGKVKQKLILNGAIRRPLALISMESQGAPICSLSCEAVSDLGLHNNPMCAGLSAQSGTDPRYSNKALLVTHQMKIKNHGPGVLYDLKMIREDSSVSTSEVLYKTVVNDRITELFPSKELFISDQLPCYVSNYYPHSVRRFLKEMKEGTHTLSIVPSRNDSEAPDCGDVGTDVSTHEALVACQESTT